MKKALMLSAAAIFGFATAGHAGQLTESQAQQLNDSSPNQKQITPKRAAKKTDPADAYAADLNYKAPMRAAAPVDDSLTFKGVTLYGLLDMGVGFIAHDAPLNNLAGAPRDYLVSANGRTGIFGVAPNALSTSFVGIRGKQEIGDNLFAIFNLQAGFNPESGTLSNGLGSVSQNNGLLLSAQNAFGDSAKNGQIFNNAAYFGLSSPIYGTLTLGRQSALSSDNIGAYDPMANSVAFSVIGFQGFNGGGGDTEDRIWDNSIEYKFNLGPFRIGLETMLRTGTNLGSQGNAFEGDIGFDYAGFSFDFLGGKIFNGVSASPLSAAQLGTVSTTANTAGIPVGQTLGVVAGTVSDNTLFQALGKYSIGQWKFYGGYEYVRQENPENPLAPGATLSGGYILGVPNNTAFGTAAVRQTGWVGAKYAFTSTFDGTIAYYHEERNSFVSATNPTGTCSNSSSTACSGQLDAVSVMVDWRFAKRFDMYAGVMYSQVTNGLASGFLQTGTAGSLGTKANNWDPTIGLRFQF